MKLQYTKILLFFFPLNILLTSYHAHNKNKPSITPHHTRSTTSRLLSEYDTESSIYDSDEEINSVKEIFERQMSQRFEEYEERMITQRQKYKEQRDKDIQKIIHKDKMEKNLAEKIEKGCLRCGCGLGSVAGSIGLFGAVAINIWKPAAVEAAITAALNANALKIAAAANAGGAAEIIKSIKSTFLVKNIAGQSFESFFTETPYKNVASIAQAVYEEHLKTCIPASSGSMSFRLVDANRDIPFCQSVWKQTQALSRIKKGISYKDAIEQTVQNIVTQVEEPANAAAKIAEAAEIATIKEAEEKTIEAASTQMYGAIGYCILAILIIVLIMLIIYLILRYRRKKKMKKKAQYTKLLNE
ncbi:PIR protein, putative [Plasmodium sp.]|nr:PIR protein, putative [Plasmodium sp.]